jgi:hypothetical protein
LQSQHILILCLCPRGGHCQCAIAFHWSKTVFGSPLGDCEGGQRPFVCGQALIAIGSEKQEWNFIFLDFFHLFHG